MSDNPFKFPNWLNHDGDGGTKTTDEVLLGQNNRIHSPDDSNPLSDTLTGATIIDVRTPGNAALVGNNGTVIEAGIGVYGHSCYCYRSRGRLQCVGARYGCGRLLRHRLRRSGTRAQGGTHRRSHRASGYLGQATT
jgi:hypothetical protein